MDDDAQAERLYHEDQQARRAEAAHHEAGHAVVALALGMDVERVTIRRTRGSDGRTFVRGLVIEHVERCRETTPGSDLFRLVRENRPRGGLRSVERHIVMLFAGFAAQRLKNPDASLVSARSDLDMIKAMAAKFLGRHRQMGSLGMYRLELRAKELVAQRHGEI